MAPDPKLPICSRCIKFLMFTFNFFFMVIGIILVSIGAVMYSVDNHVFLSILPIPHLFMALGSIIFFVAFFGCCGAIMENYCMILTFTSLMVLLLIVELTAGISGYILRNDARDFMTTHLNTMMDIYEDNPHFNANWDHLQTYFECCGTNRPEDWLNKTTGLSKNGTLLLSCCRDVSGAWGSKLCSLDKRNSTLHDTGCVTSISNSIEKHAVQLGGASLGIAFVQLLAIVFSICLAKATKNKYEVMNQDEW